MKKFFLFAIPLFALACFSAELEVDYSGKKNGAYRNFKSALDAAKDGDTIKILKMEFTIYDSIIVRNRKNLTVDGMFNTFSGLEKADHNNWKQVSPGLWKRDINTNTGISMRYFMVINGKLNRMGRLFKAPNRIPYKKVSELKDNEWTVIAGKDVKGKRTKPYSIYLKLPVQISDISQADVKEPRINHLNGVEISGKCSNLTFKNMVCRNFWNDGYNIHNHAYNIVFDTICAIDCGDDGISAHEDCEIKVKNFVSLGNSTGICHIQQVTASHVNCYIEGALGKDIFFKNDKSNRLNNVLKNVFVKTSSIGGVCLGAAPQDKLTIDKLTVVLETPESRCYFTPAAGTEFNMKNVSVLGKTPKNMEKFKAELFKKFNGTF